MKTAIFTVSMMFVLGLTGCGQLTKMLEQTISDNTTKISGTATLHNQTNHSGITVKMGKQVQAQALGISAQSVTTSFTTVATTGVSGVFSFDVTMGSTSASSIHSSSIDLATGLYTVVFSKDGYESVTVDNVPVVLGQSVYNLDDVELQVVLPDYFTLNRSWTSNGSSVTTITNLTSRYHFEVYDITPDDSDMFFVAYQLDDMSTRDPNNSDEYGAVKMISWNELKNKVYGGVYENCKLNIALRSGADSTIKLKLVKTQ
jgi:hypothetical protein